LPWTPRGWPDFASTPLPLRRWDLVRKYEENMKEYFEEICVEIMKEYVGICALGYGNPTKVACRNQQKCTWITCSVDNMFLLIAAYYSSRVSIAQAEYVGNMKKYVENMKKYVALGTRRAKRGASHRRYFSFHIKALAFGIIPSSPHIGSGTWKNCDKKVECEISKISWIIS